MYDDNAVYVIGHGRTNNDNAITEHFKIFFIGFVIDTNTDEVIDIGCSTTIDITEKFIRSMFIGKKFDTVSKKLEESIKRKYFGSSQRAIVIAYKDALKKYEDIKHKYYQ